MKKYCILILILAIAGIQNVFAQNIYFVLNTKGNVKIKKTGKLIKTNDQISDKDILVFGSMTDAVAVISSKNGRMVLRPKASTKSSEFVCVVSEILNPGTARLSSRAGNITNQIELKKFFSDDSLHILGSIKVWISPQAFPMNTDNFFFVRYTWNGQTINKKLSSNQDSLFISSSDLYKVDGKNIIASETSNVSLHYKKGTSSLLICPFTISFLEEMQTKEIILSFKKNSNYKEDDFIKELISLLKDIYGNTDKENVKAWVKQNIGTY